MSAATSLPDLPLFPLGTVLFPGGLLPLRIFEVRYLNMISRCHKSGEPFGVVGLTRGSEVDTARSSGADAQAFASVGTLAHIIDYAAPQAGLLVIRCQGGQRFQVKHSEKLKHGLWEATAELLPEDQVVAIPEDLQSVSQGLRKLLHQLHERQVPEDQIPLLKPYRFDDCDWVANRWCELLPIPHAMKQQLLALDNPLLRLELVSDLLDKSGWT